MASGPAQVVQDLYSAFGRGDMPAILGLIADDVSWDFIGPEDYPLFGPRRGVEGAAAFFGALAQNEDITDFAPERVHVAGDTVVVEGHVAMVLRKNGLPLAYDWVHVFDIRDGRIVRCRGFTDTAQIIDAWRR